MYIFVSVVQPSVMSVRFTTTNITVCIKSFCLVSKSSLTLFQTFELYVACWAPLYMGFPRQEYQNGLPFPPPGDLSDLGIEPTFPRLVGGVFTAEAPGKPVSTVQFSCLAVSDSLQRHELQHARPPYPSPTPRVHPNPCPLSRRYHPTISSSVIPFASCPQSFPASKSFPVS